MIKNGVANVTSVTNNKKKKEKQMGKVIKIGLVFEFDVEGEHDFLFEGMTEDEVIANARRMVIDDIYTITQSGDVASQISVEIVEEKK